MEVWQGNAYTRSTNKYRRLSLALEKKILGLNKRLLRKKYEVCNAVFTVKDKKDGCDLKA